MRTTARLLGMVAGLALATAGCGWMQRISVPAAGTSTDGASIGAASSADGKLLAFESDATNLVPGDTNGWRDVFVRNQTNGKTERVSISTSGGQGDGKSVAADISDDGRYVTFVSDATNLVAGDTNGGSDVFVRDRKLGTTTRVSVATGGAQALGMSDAPAISGTGRYIAFVSTAANLVAGDTNANYDVFVRDQDRATTTLVSVALGGNPANSGSLQPAINTSGDAIAFWSMANNLVTRDDTLLSPDIFVRVNGVTSQVSLTTSGQRVTTTAAAPAISSDGNVVAWDTPGAFVNDDTNGTTDVYVHDSATGATTRVSEGDEGGLRPSISGDGRYVVYESARLTAHTNSIMNVFTSDRATARTTLTSTGIDLVPANGRNNDADISRDGRWTTWTTSGMLFDSGPNHQAEVAQRATVVPTVASITPTTAARGTTVGFTITGTGFRTGLTITSQPAGVTLTITTVTDTLIVGTLTVAPDATTGAREIIVGNSGVPAYALGATAGHCGGCLSVT